MNRKCHNHNIVVTIWIINYAAPHKSYSVWYHRDSLLCIDTKGEGGSRKCAGLQVGWRSKTSSERFSHGGLSQCICVSPPLLIYRNMLKFLRDFIFAFCEIVSLCENISSRIYFWIILIYTAAFHEIKSAKYPSKRQFAKYSSHENYSLYSISYRVCYVYMCIRM